MERTLCYGSERKKIEKDKCRVGMKGTRYLGWHSCVAL